MTETVELAAGIIAAYVEHNKIAVGDLPTLIRTVYGALSGAGAEPVEVAETVAKPTNAQIRKSITPDALISFLDGKPYKTLKRHAGTHGLTLAAYRERFGLPNDYPTTAPSYSAARSALAKSLGLGNQGRGGKAPPAAPVKAAKAPRKARASKAISAADETFT